MSTNWDIMRQYEERIKKLREMAAEEGIEGIEVNEDSVSNTMGFLHDISPPGTDPSEEPSRLLKHREDGDDDVNDEWKLP